jgi:retron-type reverse transcriptase
MSAPEETSVTCSKAALCKFLAIAPGELDYVVWQLQKGKAYRNRPKKKTDGTIRNCQAPIEQLKNLQRKIVDHILSRVQLSPSAFGGVKNRSIVKNAQMHVKPDALITLDIEKCFPNIKDHHVRVVFETLAYSGQALSLLVRVCTLDFALPQGAPTSPILANIVLKGIDKRIGALAWKHGGITTRYVDDIGISGPHRLKKMIPLVRRIVKSEGFSINESKTRVMLKGTRQQITQLLVNEKVNLPKERIEEVKIHVRALNSQSTERDWNSVSGKVYWVRAVNPHAAAKLIRQFKKQKSKFYQKPNS